MKGLVGFRASKSIDSLTLSDEPFLSFGASKSVDRCSLETARDGSQNSEIGKGLVGISKEYEDESRSLGQFKEVVCCLEISIIEGLQGGLNCEERFGIKADSASPAEYFYTVTAG